MAHRLITLIVAVVIFTMDCYSQEIQHGYIIEIRGDNVYLDLKTGEVLLGEKLQIIKEGGYFTHPVTGEKIKEDDETIAVLDVIDVRSSYSIANVYPEEAISLLQKGMKILRVVEGTSKPQSFKKAIAVQPLTVTNIQGYLGIYCGDALTEQFLKSDMFRVLDRQTLGLQTDQIVLSSGGVLSDAELLKYSSSKGADYFISGTMYEPDVVELSTGIPVRNLVHLAGRAAELATGKDLKVNVISEYVPEKIEIKRIKAIVKISLRVVEVKTGEIKFLCTEMQESEGEGDVNLEGGLLNGFKIRGGVTSFQNTITGRATELALKNLTDYINNYFNGEIKDKTYTGNVIEIKDLNKRVQPKTDHILITDHIKLPKKTVKNGVTITDTTHHVTLNKGLDGHIKPKSYLSIYSTSFNSSFTGEQLPVKSIKIGHVDVISSFKEKAEGELLFKDSFDKTSFQKDQSYARLKNLWHTVYLTSNFTVLNITAYDGGSYKVSRNIGLGYMFNWKVGAYASAGIGRSKIYNNEYLGEGGSALNVSLGITKSIGLRTNIGGGVTIRASLTSIDEEYWTELLYDLLCSSRLKSNFNIIYGVTLHEDLNDFNIQLGIGYSF